MRVQLGIAVKQDELSLCHFQSTFHSLCHFHQVWYYLHTYKYICQANVTNIHHFFLSVTSVTFQEWIFISVDARVDTYGG